MNFANNLKQLRIRRNLTQKEFAKLMNIAPSTITMYEIGQREPNFELLDKIATYFDVSTDYLLGRDIIPNSEKDDELELMLNKIQAMQSELDELKYKIEFKLK
jgi:transcriptional regulator with XRE-family HTH domain